LARLPGDAGIVSKLLELLRTLPSTATYSVSVPWLLESLKVDSHPQPEVPKPDMDEIMRTGPPIPIAVRGSGYELSVTLNATPSPEWRRIFQAPEEWREPCHPSRITVKHRMLIFTSEEARVRVWIEEIDKWIAAANRKRAGMATSVTPREGVGEDDQRQRIQEMSERLKDL
jgi:hypothetical protein